MRGISKVGGVALTALFGLVSIAVTFSATAANVFGSERPALALALAPFSAEARAQMAARISASSPESAQSLRTAHELALGALSREPVNVPAVRSLGYIAALDGNESRAEALFRYSESLSRRDVPTQMWLIESEVRQNDIVGALQHYDRALRSAPSTYDLLMPILIQATALPEVAAPVADLVRTSPPWVVDFLHRFVGTATNPDAIDQIIAAADLSVENAGHRNILSLAINRLIALGAYEQALDVHSRAVKYSGDPQTGIRDGDFDTRWSLPPFGWTLSNDGPLAAYRQTFAGEEQSVLRIEANGIAVGEVASQALVLKPGRYQLSVLVGEGEGELQGQPKFQLTCSMSGGNTLMEIAAERPPSAAPQKISGTFVVPQANCPLQKFSISIGSSFDSSGSSAWVDKVSIVPR